MRAAVFAMALALAATSAAAAEPQTIKTARGVNLKILADIPQGAGPFPAVVLASGGAGDMTQPLLAVLAAALSAEGVAVVRFDWSYRTANPASGQQSETLEPELEDMQAALAFAQGNRRLDPARIVLAGKSLGSVVAVRILEREPDLRGAVLLTPICSLPVKFQRQAWQKDIYPAFARQTRPMALIVGDQDAVCGLPALYRMALAASGPVRVAVVGGDHGFAATPVSDDLTRRNIDLAARNAVAAVSAMLAAAP